MAKSFLNRTFNTGASILRASPLRQTPLGSMANSALTLGRGITSSLRSSQKPIKQVDKTKALNADVTTTNAPALKTQAQITQRQEAAQQRSNASGMGASPSPDYSSFGEGGGFGMGSPENTGVEQTTSAPPNFSTAGTTFDLLRGNKTPKNATQSALDKLRKGYLSTFDKSEEERALEDELASFREAANMGVLGEEGQGRGKTLSLVRGRQERLLKQAGIQEQGLIDRLNFAKGAREEEQKRLATELGFTEKDLASMSAPEPIKVGNTLVQLNPATGQYEPVYTEQGESNKPVTISPGQTIVDPVTGRVIFTAPEAPRSGDSVKTATIGGSLYQYDPMSGTWNKAIQGSSASNVPASVNTDIANTKTLLDLIAQVEGKTVDGNTPGVGFFQGRTPGFALTEEGRDARFMLNNIIGSIALLRGGASFSEGEKELLNRYVPTQTDTDSVVQSKLNALKSFLNTKISNLNSQFGIDSGQSAQAEQARQLLRDSGRGFTEEEIEQAIQGMSFSNDLGTSQNGLGTLSERYESGGDPGAIGYDSTGGYSYGTYQLAHNNAQNFIRQSPFAEAFKGLTFNSRAWRSKWKEIANKNPESFAQAQKQYIEKTHYLPQVNKLAQLGLDINSLSNAVKNVVWSTAVQHGANTNVIQRALARMNPQSTEADLIKAIYEERWGGGKQFASSTPQVRQSVYNRFFGKDGELNKALSMLG